MESVAPEDDYIFSIIPCPAARTKAEAKGFSHVCQPLPN